MNHPAISASMADRLADLGNVPLSPFVQATIPIKLDSNERSHHAQDIDKLCHRITNDDFGFACGHHAVSDHGGGNGGAHGARDVPVESVVFSGRCSSDVCGNVRCGRYAAGADQRLGADDWWAGYCIDPSRSRLIFYPDDSFFPVRGHLRPDPPLRSQPSFRQRRLQ